MIEKSINACKKVICDVITPYLKRIVDWYFRDTQYFDIIIKIAKKLKNDFLLRTIGNAIHRLAVVGASIYAAYHIIGKPDIYYSKCKFIWSKNEFKIEKRIWEWKKGKLTQKIIANACRCSEVTIRKYSKNMIF